MSTRLQASALAAVLLALVALGLRLSQLTNPQPVQLDSTHEQAHIQLSVDNARIALDTDCLTASWTVSGAQHVALNGTDAAASGSARLCGEPPRLTVGFTDGTARTFSVARDIVLTHEYRLLIVALAGFAVMGAWRAVRRRIQTGIRLDLGYTVLVGDLRAFLAAESRLYRTALLIIIGTGMALRLAAISKPMGLDEAYTYLYFASKPLWDGLSNYALPNNHLFHTLLVHISTGLLGNAPWTVRLPAFAAGVLMIPATYLAARALYSRHAGLLAAAAVAVAHPLIAYSTNGRGYTLIGLFFLLLLAVAVYLRRRRSKAGWLLFALFAVLGFYTIPIMLYSFGIVALWLFLTICLQNRRRQRLLLLRDFVIATGLAGAVTLLLYLPAIARSGLHAVIANQWVAPLTWTQFREGLLPFLQTIRAEWSAAVSPALIDLVVVGFVVGVVWTAIQGRWRLLLIPVALIWIGVTMVLQHVLPFSRVFLFLLPLGLMIASAGWSALVGWLPRVPRTALVVGAACALLVWGRYVAFHVPTYPPSDADMEPIAAYLQTQLRPGDKATVTLVVPNLEYYARLHDEDPSYLHDIADAQRIFVLVNRATRQDPDFVLSSHRVSPALFGLPHRLTTIGMFDIFVMNANPPRTSASAPAS